MNTLRLAASVLLRANGSVAGSGDAGAGAGILRPSGKRNPARRHLRVTWLPGLVGDADDAHEIDPEQQRQRDAERALLARWIAFYKMLRLPALTYESIAIPVRVAFVHTAATSPVFVVLDIAVDVFEVVWITTTMHSQRKDSTLAGHAGAQPTLTDDQDSIKPYTHADRARDAITIAILHLGRMLYLMLGLSDVWLVAQVVRCLRVRDLVQYVQQMNADLSTNVVFLAAFKFSLFLFSVPHWVACAWWLLSAQGSAHPLEAPSWTAQFEQHSEYEAFGPHVASDWERYVLSLWMAWAGVTAMGYGSVMMVQMQEVVLAIIICVIQIVFYAFVLGTLFHYLVRVDENTLYFKELLNAVDQYCAKRTLPSGVTKKIRAHFEFQHRKQASSTDTIFKQMPLSLKVKVASARYFRHVQSAWCFQACIPQFLNQIVIVLKERFVMPKELLFKQGDGSRELVWLISGQLHVSTNDEVKMTLRSDMGTTIVGEFGFFLGIQRTHSVSASSTSDVTLLVLSGPDYDEIVASYPEQGDLIVNNLLRKFGIDRQGNNTADATAGTANLDERELAEFELLRGLIKQAIVERNEEAVVQMSYAASIGDVETVRALASKGVDVNTGNYDGRTTLHLAAAEGNAKVVSLLCELHADPTIADRRGCTPIMDAILGHHDECAEELRQHGVELRMDSPHIVLFEAAQAGNTQRIQTLISHGVDINSTDYDGRTAAHISSADGNMKVVEFLVSALADINLRDRHGNRPVDDAVKNERRIVAQLHAERGARANPEEVFDRMCIAASEGDVERLRFLVDAGAPIDQGDYDARTPLHLAVCAGSISATHFLLGAMADASVVDRWGQSPLIDALEHNNEVAALLVHYCDTTLPEGYKDDAVVNTLYRAAQAQSMNSLSQKLRSRSRKRTKVEMAKQVARRDLELALKTLARKLGELISLQQRLYTQLERHTEEWLNTYAAELSDTSSQGSLEDELEELENSSAHGSDSGEEADESSRTEERTSAREGRRSMGGRRNSGSGLARRGSKQGMAARTSSSSRNSAGEHGSWKRKPSISASSGAVPTAAAGAPEADHDHAEKTFTRIVLKLPKAEAGITSLRRVFAQKLSPSARAGLADAERGVEEHSALRSILADYCGFQPELVDEVLAEVYAELRAVLGPAAPVRPAEPQLRQACASTGSPSSSAGALGSPVNGARSRVSGLSPTLLRRRFSRSQGSSPVVGGRRSRTASSGSVGGAQQPGESSSLVTLDEALGEALGEEHGGDAGASSAAGARDEVTPREEEPPLFSGIAASDDEGGQGSSSPAIVDDADGIIAGQPVRRTSRSGSMSLSGSKPGKRVSLVMSSCMDSIRGAHRRGSTRDSRSGPTYRTCDCVDMSSPPSASPSVGRRAPSQQLHLSNVGHNLLFLSTRFVATLAAQATGVTGGTQDGVWADEAQAPSSLAGMRMRTRMTSNARRAPSISIAALSPPPSSGQALFNGGGRFSLSPSAGVRARVPAPNLDGHTPSTEPPHSPISLAVPSTAPAPRRVVAPMGSPGAAAHESSSASLPARYARPSWSRRAEDSVQPQQTRASAMCDEGTMVIGRGGGSAWSALRASACVGLSPPSTPPGGGGGGSSFRQPKSAAPDSLVEAARVLEGLFSILDMGHTGVIRIKDVKQLQGSLGELGSAEIRSLVTHLMRAASTLATLGESAQLNGGRERRSSDTQLPSASADHNRTGRSKAVSRAEFYVGATAWILSSADDDEPTELTEGGGVVLGGGGDGAASGTASTRPEGIPKLALGGGGGGIRAANITSKPAQEGAQSAGLVELERLLSSAPGCASATKALRKRVSSGVFNELGPANATRLAQLLAMSPETATKAEPDDIAAWCTAHLGLSLPIAPPFKSGSDGGSKGKNSAGKDGAKPGAAEKAQAAEVASADAAAESSDSAAGPTWADVARALEAHTRQVRAQASAEGGGVAPPDAGASILARAGHALQQLVHSIIGAAHQSSSAATSEADSRAAATHKFVIDHTSLKYIGFNYLFLCALMWDAMQTSVHLCYSDQADRIAWIWPVNYALDALYIARVLLRLRTSYLNENSVHVWDPRAVRRQYLGSEFTLDLIAAWPHDLFALMLGVRGLVLVGLRSVKLLQLRYVYRSYIAFERSKTGDNLLTGLVQYITVISITAHCCACVWNLLTTPFATGGLKSWEDQHDFLSLDAGGDTLADSAAAEGSAEVELLVRYIMSTFYVYSTLTTLGMATIPANYIEVGITLLMMVLNLTVYAWAVGKISALVMKQDDEVVSKRAQLELVQVYLAHVRVPQELSSRIEAFFHQRLKDASLSSIADEQIYESMPIALQIEVSTYTHRSLVGECAPLKNCSDGFIDRLSSLLRERTVEPETVIFRTTDLCKELLIIESGAVEINHDDDLDGAAERVSSVADASTIHHAGDTLGELPFVFSLRHVSTARATADAETKLLTLSTERYRTLLKSFPQQEEVIMSNVMKQHDGAMTARSARSAKSKVSQRSSQARSDIGSAVHSMRSEAARGVESDMDAIAKIITNAKQKRHNLHTVRLCGACSDGDLAKVRRLIAMSDVDVNRGDYDHRRPIHVAASAGHVGVVELLVATNADVNVMDRRGKSPLHDALTNKQGEAATMLLRLGAQRLCSTLADLMCEAAAREDGFEELRFHVAFDSSEISVGNYDGRTALHLAAAEGRIENVRLLLENKADVNARDRRGCTPLQDAYKGGGPINISELLLEYGADMGEFEAAVALCTAAAANDVPTLDRLVRHRCDVNEGDYDARTALHLASSNAHVDATHFLLKLPGINPAVEDRYGNTPYDDALREQGEEQPVVRTLLATRGGQIGSHQPSAEATVSNAEETRAAVDASAITASHEVKESVRTVIKWVSQQCSATQKMRKLVDDALTIEREDGAVLSDVRPGFWGALKLYGEGQQERGWHIQETVKPQVDKWSESLSEFAAHITRDLLLKVSTLIELQPMGSRPLEAIMNADFAIGEAAAAAAANSGGASSAASASEK